MKKVAVIGISDFPSRRGGYDSFVTELVKHCAVSEQFYFDLYAEAPLPSDVDCTGVNYRKINVLRKPGMFGLLKHRLNAFRRANSSDADAIYLLSYVALPLIMILPRRKRLLINLDGIEWRRSEYSALKRLYMKFAEWCAVRTADVLIADSIAIKDYLKAKYNTEANFVPYPVLRACTHEETKVDEVLGKYSVDKFNYYLVVGRCVKENHVFEILNSFELSDSKRRFILVTDKRNNSLRSRLEEICSSSSRVAHFGPIYDEQELSILRRYCFAYIHGHSVGGTNPSLLESMLLSERIIAHDNVFNREVLGLTGFYFKSESDLASFFSNEQLLVSSRDVLIDRVKIAKSRYNIEDIVERMSNLVKN